MNDYKKSLTIKIVVDSTGVYCLWVVLFNQPLEFHDSYSFTKFSELLESYRKFYGLDDIDSVQIVRIGKKLVAHVMVNDMMVSTTQYKYIQLPPCLLSCFINEYFKLIK